jgi:hypothetical protein
MKGNNLRTDITHTLDYFLEVKTGTISSLCDDTKPVNDIS